MLFFNFPLGDLRVKAPFHHSISKVEVIRVICDCWSHPNRWLREREFSKLLPSAYATFPSSPYSHILSTEVTMAAHTRSGGLLSLPVLTKPLGGCNIFNWPGAPLIFSLKLQAFSFKIIFMTKVFCVLSYNSNLFALIIFSLRKKWNKV